MAQPWSFARRLGAGLAACAVLAVLVLVGAAVAVRGLLAGERETVQRAAQDLVAVEQLERHFADKLAAARGYLLSGGQRDYLQERNRARAAFLSGLGALRARLADRPEALALLDEVQGAEAEHHAAQEQVARAVRGRVGAPELDRLRDEVLAGPRQHTLGHLEALARWAQGQLDAAAAHQAAVERRALGMLLAQGALGLGLLAVLGWVLGRTLGGLYRDARQSERRFRLLTEGVRDASLCLLDPEGRVAEWNAGAERLFGYRREEALGRPMELLHAPEAVAAGVARLQLARAAREGRLATEGWRQRRDGSRFWAETVLTALEDERGRLEGYAELTRDATERRRVEQAQALYAEAGRVLPPLRDPLLLQRTLARLCVGELADACVVWALDERGGGVRAVAWAAAGGEPEGARLGGLLAALPPVPVGLGPGGVLYSGRSELLAHVASERLPPAVRQGGYGRLLEALDARSALTVPLPGSARTLAALTLVSTRVERPYTAVDLAFVEELGARAALTLENAALWAEAQGALELIGVAAHDLGNPLWTLQLRLRRLLQLPEGEGARVRDGLAQAERQARALGQLLHNLLDLSRASAGALTLEGRSLDLAALAREVGGAMAEQASEVGSPLAVSASEPVGVRGDRLRLERVVMNLLSNALKFGRGRPVELRVRAEGERAVLEVEDHGEGIPPDVQARLFGRFTRAPGTSGKAGFGLGLYIVRQLVEAHGGSVAVHSTPGDGARFRVELPRVALAAEEAEPERDAARP